MSSPNLTTISVPEPNSSAIAISAQICIPSTPPLSNPTFLFLPFWGGTAATYTHVQQSLLARLSDHASIAVSYKGTGTAFSAIADNDKDPNRHSTESLAYDLLRLLNSPQLASVLHISNLIICAHSMSAKIAYRLINLFYSGDNEKRVHIQSLLLLAPAPPTPLILPPEVREQQLIAYDNAPNAKWTIENVLSSTPLDEKIVRRFVDGCGNMSEGAKRGWIEVGMAESVEEVLRGMGKEVKIKVLAGEEDKVETLERVQRETVEVLKGSGFEVEFRLLEGCGHLVPVERVEVVVEELCALATEGA